MVSKKQSDFRGVWHVSDISKWSHVLVFFRVWSKVFIIIVCGVQLQHDLKKHVLEQLRNWIHTKGGSVLDCGYWKMRTGWKYKKVLKKPRNKSAKASIVSSEKIERNEEPVTHNPNEIYFAFWGRVFVRRRLGLHQCGLGCEKCVENT